MISGITKTLFEWNKTIEYDLCYLGQLGNFLALNPSNWEARQDAALSLAKLILYPHMKQDLPDLGIKLSQLERNLHELSPYQRDHVCHAVLTFLLGHWIISKLNLYRYRGMFFQWKLSSLLHDVGYSVEIINRLDNQIFSYFERNLLNKERYNYTPPQRCDRLREYSMMYSGNNRHDLNMFDLFSERFSDWGLDLDANSIFNDMCNGKKIDTSGLRTDHGIISSIFVVKSIDYLYEINNPKQLIDPYCPWNYENIQNDIINVGASIFIHNLNRDDLVWDFNNMPLATLLKICDELQDWGRPMDSNPNGNSPSDYDINYVHDNIVFSVNHNKLAQFRKISDKIRNFPIAIRELKKQC